MTQSPSHLRFSIDDPSAWLSTGFGLSERDFERNAFIGLFSLDSIQNLKSKIQNLT